MHIEAFVQGGVTMSMTMTRSGFLRGALAVAGAARDRSSAVTASRVPAVPAEPGNYRVLVLSGGIAYGAYEAGVLYGLTRAAGGPRAYDAVCGTSAGALNGAMYVSGNLEPLRNLWLTVSTRRVLVVKPQFATILQKSAGIGTRAYQLISLLLGVTGGNIRATCQSDPVTTILRELLAPNGKIVDFSIPLFWAVTDLTDGCGGVFYRDAGHSGNASPAYRNAVSRVMGTAPASGRYLTNAFGVRFIGVETADEFIETLRASSAIPGVFDPADIDGRLLVDGGVVNNTPLALVRQAVQNGPVTVDVVLLGSDFRGQENAKSKNLIQIVQGLYALIGQRLTDDAVRALAGQDVASRSSRALVDMRSALAAQSASGRSLSTKVEALKQLTGDAYLPNDVTINMIRPSIPQLNGNALDFTDQNAITANFNQGLYDVTTFGFTPYQTPTTVCELGSG